MCKLLTLTANQVEVLPSPPSFRKFGWKCNLTPPSPPAEKGGGVHTLCKPLTLTANRNKKRVRCHNESWQHNFFNPRFSGIGSKLIKKKCPFMEKPIKLMSKLMPNNGFLLMLGEFLYFLQLFQGII